MRPSCTHIAFLSDSYLSVEVYNTFDGPGFPACNAVAKVYRPSSVDEIVSIVKDAISKGVPVRASGVSDPIAIRRLLDKRKSQHRMRICGVSLNSYATESRIGAHYAPVLSSHVDDTMCSDDPNTIIIKTDDVNDVYDLELKDGVGSVWVEAGATFPQM